MYEQVEKPKENKSRAVANSVAQKKNGVKQGFGFVDNRPEHIVARSLQMKNINEQSQLTKDGILQRKKARNGVKSTVDP